MGEEATVGHDGRGSGTAGARWSARASLAVVIVAVVATLATLVAPIPVEAQEDICYSDVVGDVVEAQESYAVNCGMPYSSTSGFHRCDWLDGEGGWRCQGPTGTDPGGTDPAPDPGTGGDPADETCTGAASPDIAVAKQSYTDLCGVEYSDTSGFHRCDWVPADNGWRCTGPSGTSGSGGPTEPGGTDPGTGDTGGGTTGGPTGNGPDTPTDLVARPVQGDTASVNPDGIKLTWNPGGGPESIGFNINRDGEFLTSIGDPFYVDCDTVAGRTYTYTVSAWSEGPEFSFTSGSVTATAEVTPSECLPLTPPGPGGPDGPYEDPIFTVHERDVTRKPAQPQQVKIVGDRLQWEMPPGPRYLFQISRNASTERVGEQWGQLSVTSGHPDLQYSEIGGGSVRFSVPIGQFAPGDRFNIQAIHPYDIEVNADARFSPSSRYAMIRNPGAGQEIGTFLDTFGTGDQLPGAWIGSRDDWKTDSQFSDDFSGSGLLADQSDPKWFFARNDGSPSDITPAPTRDGKQTDQRARLNNDKLEMSVSLADSSYSYIGTDNDKAEGYQVDPTNGVFVEASVRLDKMTPADNAWWAFWLMAPGADACDANGQPVPGARNAYDGHADTGTEIDVFEFVPDLGNGYNQALFRYENKGDNCDPPSGGAKLSPYGRNFTYERFQDIPGVTMPTYDDGNYHRLGMYYAQNCYAFYLDDQLLWHVTEEDNPNWVTSKTRQSIRLTWEMQNPRTENGQQINNPWTGLGGNFSNTASDIDPTVYIDFVHVWEKKESANGVCGGGTDPEPEPDPVPPAPAPELQAPVDLSASASDAGVQLTWTSGGGLEPDGYDVRRDGEGYWSVGEAEFLDTNVVAGQTYEYQIVPWTEGPGGNPTLRTYGPASSATTATAVEGAGGDDPTPDPSPDPDADPDLAPVGITATATHRSVTLSWGEWVAANPTTVDGYRIHGGSGASSPVGSFTTGTEFTDVGDLIFPIRPDTEYTYNVQAFKIVDTSGVIPLYEYGPPATITIRTEPEPVFETPGPVSEGMAVWSYDGLENAVAVEVFWNAPEEWADEPVTGYEVWRNGSLIRRVTEEEAVVDGVDATGEPYRANMRSFVDGPHTPRHQLIGSSDYLELTSSRPVYEIAAYRGTGDSRSVGPSATATTLLFSNTPVNIDAVDVLMPHPALVRAVGAAVPDISGERQTRLVELVADSHYRTQSGLNAHPAKVGAMRTILNDEGFVFEEGFVTESMLWPLTMTAAPQVNQISSEIVAQIVERWYPPQRLEDIVPGYLLEGGFDPHSLQDKYGTTGLSQQARANRFFANKTELEAMLEALPARPDSASQVEAIEVEAFAQAELLLDIDVGKRGQLWEVLRLIEDGLHPTKRAENDDGGGIIVPTTTEFSRLWNASTKAERLAYLDLDPLGWELAKPYLELSKQMDSIQDDLENWFKPLVMVVLATTVGVITGGLATSAYASFFSVAATSTGAVAFGAASGAYIATMLLTGSTSEAEKSAWRALFISILASYAEIPAADRTHTQAISIALLEGGVALLDGGDFAAAFVAALARHYVPGLASQLDRLGSFEDFATDLFTIIVESYISNDGDESAIVGDIEAFALQRVSGYVSNYVGDRLPASWGTFGEGIGDVVGVALESGGDEGEIRGAIASMLASSLGEQLRPVLAPNGEDTLASQMYDDLSAILVDALELPSDQRAAFVDEKVQSYLFSLAGETVASSMQNVLVSANDGQSTVLIEAATGLVEVAVSSLYLEGDDYENAILTYVSNELQGYVNEALPGCAPQWLTGLTSQMAGVVIDAAVTGNSDNVSADLTSLVNHTAAGGELPAGGLGTCHLVNEPVDSGGETGGGSGDLDCVHPESGATLSVRSAEKVTETSGEFDAERCAEAVDFRVWLLGLSSVDLLAGTETAIESNRLFDVITARDEPRFTAFRLRTELDENQGMIEVQHPTNSSIWDRTGYVVAVIRNTSGEIVDFKDLSEVDIEAEILTDEPSGGIVEAVWDYATGCYDVVSGMFADFSDALVELWMSGDIVEYLLETWAQFEAMVEAFNHNPAAFFDEFLREFFALNTLDESPARWAGEMSCSLGMALVPGLAATRFANVFRYFADPNQGLDDFTRRYPAETDTPIGCPIVTKRSAGGTRPCGNTYPAPETVTGPNFAGAVVALDDRLTTLGLINMRINGVGVERVQGRAVPIPNAWQFEFEVTGIVQEAGQRAGYELDNTVASLHNAAPNSFHRAHLSGPGGMGHEVGITLHAPRDLNLGFMKEVENQLQAGRTLALAKGWELRYTVSAQTHASTVFTGLSLAGVSYRADFVLPDGSTRPYLRASAQVDKPGENRAGKVIPGAITTDKSLWP